MYNFTVVLKTMKVYKLKGLLTEQGWLKNVFVSCDETGKIIALENKLDHKNFVDLNVYAIPGFQNAHSHAFQYAMAGIAERHSTENSSDDFWSWREAMYKLALRISPDDLEKIATLLYFEMLRHGYTHVAEFHYVHHDKNGKPYDHLAEMGERLINAAKNAGIGITLIPIFYQKGGFGKQPSDGQKRFISSTIVDYEKLYLASEKSCSNYTHANIGIGIHSLRGVEPNDVIQVAQNFSKNVPFHIHVAEQKKEVDDCISYTGKRPVQWLLDNIDLSERFHLVHATHLNESEIKGIAKSNANVVICPSTEGNLGDGFFSLYDFQNQSGNWSIGTDSHVGLNPLEELRILDYGQRLKTHKRNSFFSSQNGDSALFAIEKITHAGRKAMNNFNQQYFKVGEYFDAALFDADSPLIATSSENYWASTIVYASDATHQKGVISKGKLIHLNDENEFYTKAKNEFIQCLNELKNRI